MTAADPLARLRAVIAEAEAGPSVRALVWTETAPGQWTAPALFGRRYTVGFDGGWFWAGYCAGGEAANSSEAQDGAQGDYEGVLRACLTPTPLPAAEEIAAAIREAALVEAEKHLRAFSNEWATDPRGVWQSKSKGALMLSIAADAIAALRRADPRDGAERGA